MGKIQDRARLPRESIGDTIASTKQMQKKKQGSKFKRKAAKLFRHPGAFFRDSALGRLFGDPEVVTEAKQPAFAWAFAAWKRELICRYFPQYEFHFVPLSRSPSSWPRLDGRNPKC